MSGQIVSTVQDEENEEEVEQEQQNEEDQNEEDRARRINLLARGHSKMYYSREEIPRTYKPLTEFNGRHFKYTIWVNPFNGFILREDPSKPHNKQFLLLQTQSGHAYIYYRGEDRSNGRILVGALVREVLLKHYGGRVDKETQTLLI